MQTAENIPLLATATLPPVSWFLALKDAAAFILETQENYLRQTYRNRYNIVGPNGIQTLSIPVQNRHGEKMPIRDVRIDYREPWQRNHWRSITTAYRNSPYFIYLGDEFAPFYEKKAEFLFDLNLEFIQLIFRIMKKKTEIRFSDSFRVPGEYAPDFRYTIHPKQPPVFTTREYRQVFHEKLGFYPDLSILDLLFNLGPKGMC